MSVVPSSRRSSTPGRFWLHRALARASRRGGGLRHIPKAPAAHENGRQADAVDNLNFCGVIHPVGQPVQFRGPQPGADVVDQRLLGAVTEHVMDLAVPCEHGGAEGQ